MTLAAAVILRPPPSALNRSTRHVVLTPDGSTIATGCKAVHAGSPRRSMPLMTLTVCKRRPIFLNKTPRTSSIGHRHALTPSGSYPMGHGVPVQQSQPANGCSCCNGLLVHSCETAAFLLLHLWILAPGTLAITSRHPLLPLPSGCSQFLAAAALGGETMVAEATSTPAVHHANTGLALPSASLHTTMTDLRAAM